MHNSYLNFIGYENQDFFPKIEMGLEECLSHNSMTNEALGKFSIENESRNLFMASQQSLNLIHNIFEAAFNPTLDNFEKPKKHLPFKIIRQEIAEKKEEKSTSDETSVSVSIADKIADKSRRIIKREKAKQRNIAKNTAMPTHVMDSTEISQKCIPEELNQANLEDKSQKKMAQMIRNRISAQNSRDRKREYMKKLEVHQRKVAADNIQYQKEIKQLKQANEALKIECEHLKRCLMSTISETHDKLYQSEAAFTEDVFGLNSRQNGEIGAESKSNSLLKKSLAPNHLMKYSLALATLFAVLMFSNICVQNGNSSTRISQIGQQLNTFESKIEEAFLSYRRKLEEGSAEIPKAFSDKEMKIEIERDLSDPSSNVTPSSNLEFDQLRKLKNIFHGDYMTKFMNQLKVNVSEDLEVNNSITLPQYLKQSLNTQKNPDSQHQVDLTRENHSTLFCPSGFAIQTNEKDRLACNFSIKVEDGFENDNRRDARLNKSEWLKLIVPKSNLLPTSFDNQDRLKISNEQGYESEDSSLIELWCKVLNVRTLQSGF